MDKRIEIIGIDHGWSNMKTATQVFTTGVKEITTEPAFLIMLWNLAVFITRWAGSVWKSGTAKWKMTISIS